MANTLLLRLDGALQSWGERAKWGVRDSAPEPTKSGVIGLVACALGWAADEQLRHLSDSTVMGVRCDSVGQRITDYHTIGGGYATPALLDNQGKPKKTPKGAPHTEQSWRDYLCDASFLVALRSDDEALVAQMAAAVQDPVWPIYLGRKACHPSVPVYVTVGMFDSFEAAFKSQPLYKEDVREKNQPEMKPVRIVIESDTGEGVMRRDQFISRSKRRYAPRYTYDGTLSLPIVDREVTP